MFKDQAVTFTEEELTVLSDILRRLAAGGLFTSRPQFVTAAHKINIAKFSSWRGVTESEVAEDLAWWNEEFPPGVTHIGL